MADEQTGGKGIDRRALLLAAGTTATVAAAPKAMAAAGQARIDAHTHFTPLKFLDMAEKIEGRPFALHKLINSLPALTDVRVRMEMLDRNHIDLQVLVPVPWIEGFPKLYADPKASAEAARLVNDELAAVIATHPKRFRGVAILPVSNQEAMVAELHRCVKQLGFLGAYIAVGPTTRHLDDPHFEPLYQAITELDATLWLHPSRPPTVSEYVDEKLSKYRQWDLVGWPYDSTSAMFRVVFSGVFDRHPGIRIVVHHHGAFIPLLAPRLNNLFMADEALEPMETEVKPPFIQHFKKFYCDTAASGIAPKALELAVDFFGPERVLFGTDAPFGPKNGQVFVEETLRSIDMMAVTPQVRTAILSGNAKRILKLG